MNRTLGASIRSIQRCTSTYTYLHPNTPSVATRTYATHPVNTLSCIVNKRNTLFASNSYTVRSHTLHSTRHTSTDSMAEQDVLVTRFPENGTALVRLNRPKSLNALNASLTDALLNYLKQLNADESVRAIVLTGNEKAFAAGADIRQMKELDYASITSSDFLNYDIFNTFKTPIIAAVNGYALGGGCELAMMCDIIIAGDKAIFGQPEIKLGTIPGLGGTQRLTRAVGKSKAMELILTGDNLDAATACTAGLVSRVVESSKLEDEALKMAAKIASYSLPALKAAKETVNRAYESSLQEGLLYERRMFQASFATADRKEGMEAFVAKRQAIWSHH